MTITFRRAFLCPAGFAAIIAAAFAGETARAEDEPELAAVDDHEFGFAGTFEGPAPLIGREGAARVYLEQPVGRVSIGEAHVGPGARKYAARSRAAGSAEVISFSSRPVGEDVAQASIGQGQLPLARARLTSGFGVPRPAAGGGTRWHAGVDLAASTGSPVAAAYAGRVRLADWKGGYGLLVIVDHGGGMQTRYAHLSRLGVVAGQQVGQGDLIGFVGSTGNSTGPHLHYELRRNGQPVNPLRQ